MVDVVDRVRKLVALSSSPNENEARTAALAACRLILEHKLVVGAADDEGSSRSSVVGGRPQRSEGGGERPEPESEIEQAFRARAAAVDGKKGERAREQWIKIRSKFAGACRHCGRFYDKGEYVLWRKGSKVAMHPPCAFEYFRGAA